MSIKSFLFSLSNKQEENLHTLGVIQLVLGNLLVSFDPLLVRLSGVSGWNTSFWFGIYTFISMMFFTWRMEEKGLSETFKRSGFPVILAGVIMSGSAILFIMSVKLTLVANTAVIKSATPIFAAIFGLIILKEKTSRRTWVAIAFSLIGIFIVVSGSVGKGNILGDLLAVISTALVSLNLTLWRKRPHVSKTLSIALAGLTIALISSLFSSPFSLQPQSYLLLAVMGLLTAPLGRLATATATKYLPVAEVSLFLPLNSILSPIWIWLVIGESPTLTTFTGGGIIVTTLFIHTLLNMRSSKS